MPEKAEARRVVSATGPSDQPFQQQVVDLARIQGWRVYHTFDGCRFADGFPNLVVVRGPHVIFSELKRDTGRVSSDQEAWLTALDEVAEAVDLAAESAAAQGIDPRRLPHLEVHIWRPADWPHIKTRLADPIGRRA
jgi:hypothetical protein